MQVTSLKDLRVVSQLNRVAEEKILPQAEGCQGVKLVRVARLELATPCLEGRYSTD